MRKQAINTGHLKKGPVEEGKRMLGGGWNVKVSLFGTFEQRLRVEGGSHGLPEPPRQTTAHIKA